MPYLVLGVALIVFTALLHRLHVIQATHTAWRQIAAALTVMRGADIPEREKERAIQRTAGRLVITLADILARSLVAVTGALVVYYGALTAGLLNRNEVIDAAWNPVFIVATTACAAVAWRYVR